MLVLSRKVGQKILLGDRITITVVRVNGGGVRLGIEAPAELPVLREEMQLQQGMQDQANARSPSDLTASDLTASELTPRSDEPCS